METSLTSIRFQGTNAIRTTDPVGNVVTNSYDARGRKIASSDPDLGTWSYAYNTLDQLVSQTDAKGQVTTVTVAALLISKVASSELPVWLASPV